MPPQKLNTTAVTAIEAPSVTTTTTRVVIVGAGPGGLLAAIFLLRRNLIENTSTKYEVTLVDPGVNYGKLDEDGLSKFRSWMIGLSAHGLTSIKEIPGLFEDYVSTLGVQVGSATFGIGPKLKFEIKMTDEEKENSGFMMDRNYVCAALARYLNDNFGNSKTTSSSADFISYYNTLALFVDSEKHRVLVRTQDKDSPLTTDAMLPLEYDVLLGCDGIRSVVRNAFLTNHRDFEFDIKDNFGTGKSVHIARPKDVDEGRFMILMNCVPNCSAFVLPERGDQLNFACGYNLNKPCDPELLSKDPAVIAAYAKKHFQGFDMDFEEFGQRWAEQKLGTTQMVHCNFYHSMKLRALLLGDAAHATVPNIGQGMNTALADASALNKLLDTHADDWNTVLPAFSEERVKEGNALTEMSFNTFSLDGGMMMSIALRQNFHRFLNRFLPTWLLEMEPLGEVTKGMKLSVAYDKMVQYGYMAKSRQMNDDIKRTYFELKTGMVKERKTSFGKITKFWFTILVAVVSYAVGAKWHMNGISL
jgi:kynurenine 3-monooxygenase